MLTSSTKVSSGIQRFRLAVQKNRAYLFLFAASIAYIVTASGLVSTSWIPITLILIIALVSAYLVYTFYQHYPEKNIDFSWLLLDSLLITWGIHISGGIHSVWFPWYLANVSGAAFVAGTTWAFSFAFLDILLYLGALFFRRDIQGIDAAFIQALLQIVMLMAASSFFIYGAAALQRKRQQVKKLKEEESFKVQELLRLTKALDERTHQLAEANKKIRQADRMKSQFLANMSHELRTPLNSIIGFSEILLDRLKDQIDPKFHRFLQNIHTSGKHLLGIINDLLDLSKIESGKMELHPERFSLKNLIEGVCVILKGMAHKASIELRIEAEENLPPLEADPVKVKQILYNLISNAIKFSPPQREVVISAAFLPKEHSPLKEDALQIAIKDQGIGIDPQYHQAIFEEFRQVDGSVTRQYGGTGLGLSLVKRFVELHRGKIEVESALGKGSTFTVTLPTVYKGVTVEEARLQPEISEKEEGQTILVVEDDPTAFETIANILHSAGYTSIRAHHGEEALKMARMLKPAAITLDIILPGMDGWEVMKALKNDETLRHIPVIIVSMMENRELGFALGAADYFVKPIDPEELIHSLETLLPHKKKGKPKLLLIDDDPDFHEMMENILRFRGYQVEHALSGQEGLQKASQGYPDLIILDLMMEGMDGFEVAGALKKRKETRKIPILVLTAKQLTPRDKERLKGEISKLMEKGRSSPADLVLTIQELLKRHA